MKFFHKSHHQQAADRIRAYKDFYEFHKTVLNGFPANPSCLAYDNDYHLLAVGTKTGLVQIYGKPGVEFHFDFDSDVEVIRLNFVPGRGQLVALCSDQSLHLLQIAYQIDQPSVRQLYSNEEFVDDDSNRIITSLSISPCADLIFVGTKAADIYLLDSRDLKCNTIIKQEVILKAVSNEPKLKPGSIEAIEEHTAHKGNILIGFSRSLVALWNYEQGSLVNSFKIDQQLESLSWNNDGIHFITSHNDGSYITWNSQSESGHVSHNSSKSPYGPFPCKAITKILWNTTKNREFFIFSGGMPRASYGDKEAVSIIFQTTESNTEKNQVLDFTSKVVDFALITSEENIPKALVVLTEEELVVIDLTMPDWPQFKLPYLCCLHSSPVTCSQHYTDINSQIFQQIIDAGLVEDGSMKYSPNTWPINGGVTKFQESGTTGDVFDLLITGHEDGTVRFWNASSVSLKHIYTLHTSKFFQNADDDLMIANIDCDETDLDEGESEWPPFKKVGHFDPYSDDPRFAIRKIAFCPATGQLAVGGTAGQIVVLVLKDKPEEVSPMAAIEMKFISESEGFVWKSHSPLVVTAGLMKMGAGFQPTTLVQVLPPAALTALTMSTQWQVIAAGTAHGFGLFDLAAKKVLVAKTTLKPSNLIAGAGGDALITRRKSFKKSLRESFRRLRRGRSQKSKRNITSNQTKIQEIKKGNARLMPVGDDIETRPVERSIEARTESNDSMINSMVRYLYFCSAAIINNTVHPTFWVGTNAGTVYVYVRTGSGDNTWQLAKEVQIKHKAPIIFIRLIDGNGIPIFENNYTEGDKLAQTRALICSEEQFKLFALPNFKTLHKFKLTAHEGARVRKMELGFFVHRTQKAQSEHSLLCLTNLGDMNVFATNDFKRKFQYNFIKKEDINGITSLIFTKFGEGFYLRSSSEYQRFSVSTARVSKLECFLHLNEALVSSVEPERAAPTTSTGETSIKAEVANVEEAAGDGEANTSKLNISGVSVESNSTGNTSLNRTVESVIEHISQVVIDELKENEPPQVSPVSNGNIAPPLSSNS